MSRDGQVALRAPISVWVELARGSSSSMSSRCVMCRSCVQFRRTLFTSPGWGVVRGRSPSSTKWLQRQRKDPLVRQAAVEQLRCRSAFKLIELDNKYNFLKKGSIVVDCGAKPGSWSQIAAKRIGTDTLSREDLVTCRYGVVLSVDIGAISELPGAIVMGNCDILDLHTHDKIKECLGCRKADVVMSDMAPNASGLHDLDHQRIMELCRSAATLADEVLKEGGVFLCKILQGAHTRSFLSELKQCYEQVKECRLKATRKESTEIYVFAKGYKQNTY